MQFETLASSNISKVYAAMMGAFADYVMPVKLTQEQFEMKLKRDGVVADITPIAVENQQIVGFNLMGLGEWNGITTAYDAATGVLPAFRGNGITRKLFDFIRPTLENVGVKQCLLEVIIGNDGAHHIYEKMGFKPVRELVCYNGEPQGEYNLPEGFSYVGVDNLNLDDFQTWKDWQPSWQNSDFASRNILNRYQVVGVVKDGALVAYALLFRDTGYVAQMAVSPEYRRMGIGSRMFAFMAALAKKPLHYVNVEAEAVGSHAFLKKIGMEETVRQYEMVMSL